jgi:hypothetical protein
MEGAGIMEYELRVIVEKVAVNSQEVVKRETITTYEITTPVSIMDLGLRHAEQISLLEKMQQVLVEEQAVLIDLGYERCPNCGQKIKKNGYTHSQFHAVFSDHQVRLQKHRCSHPDCRWQSFPTISSVFGTNIHPDLAKLQCEQGALYSYREAENNLEKVNGHHRGVNNHTQVKRMTNKVGAHLAEENRRLPSAEECAAPAQDVIIQVDGGHIPIQEPGKRSFEALSAIVYRPESLHEVDQYHRKLVEKTCVVSALDDDLQTMKTYLLNAARKQGMTQESQVTALADGANNCWSVLSVVQPHCKTLECILDWFHIGKKFQNIKNALGEAFEKSLESIKWKLWHGKVSDALTKLTLLRENITDEEQRSKMTGLYDYIQHNQAYIVNYEERNNAKKPYTSQVAESHVDTIINARHKKTRKMQWTREGAHHVLQIRAMIASEEWSSKWQSAVLSSLKDAV